MKQIAIAEPLAEPGEVVLSPEAWLEAQGSLSGVSVLQLHYDAVRGNGGRSRTQQ